MVNLTVVKVNDVLKYLVKVTLVITIIVAITRFFNGIKQNEPNLFNNENMLISAVKQVIPGVKQYFSPYNNNGNKFNLSDTYKIALNSELGIVQKVTSRESADKREEIEQQGITSNENIENQNDINNEESNIEIVQTGVTTQVLDTTYNKYSCNLFGVQVKNESIYELNESDYDITNANYNKKDVLIFHTHTCESYTSSEAFPYQATGNYRTTDLNFTVSRVGDELEKYLKQFGFNVFHDKTYHDYPAYSGSYGRSMKTVEKLLGVYTEIDIVIDLHRDAIGDNTYSPKVKIGDEVCAQLMFVIGTDGSGLEHPNWKQNLQFALQVQKKANELYPGLFKPIIVRNSRYNQQLATGACIIEVGATGNTMEECLNSMKYLSKVLSEL